MKAIVNLLATTAVMGVGMRAGMWLWEEVLEDKVDNLMDNLAKKVKKGEGA